MLGSPAGGEPAAACIGGQWSAAHKPDWTATQLRSNMEHNHNNFNRNKCQLDSQKFVGIVFESKPKLLGSNCPLQSMFIKRQNTRAETSECLPRDFQSKILRCV